MYNETMADDTTRPYRKRKRARQEEQTRQRITEAVVELHRTVGPARTEVTRVAELAGVSRMTVYNHFPTEADLIAACSAHWSDRHPPPDPGTWAVGGDPRKRLRRGLGDLYAWYASTEDMMGNVLRDAPLVEPLGRVMDAGWRPYLDRVVDRLAEGWTAADGDETEAIEAAVRVAVDFQTWRLLAARRGTEGAVALAARMVEGVLDEASQAGHR